MRFSVIICTYNREKYIAASLRAVCLQTFTDTNFELLMVDNNSPDNTKAVFDTIAAEYPEVQMRYILETEQGISYAATGGNKRGWGGEYIVFIDDDETIDDFYLEKLDNYLTAYSEAQLALRPYCRYMRRVSRSGCLTLPKGLLQDIIIKVIK